MFLKKLKFFWIDAMLFFCDWDVAVTSEDIKIYLPENLYFCFLEHVPVFTNTFLKNPFSSDITFFTNIVEVFRWENFINFPVYFSFSLIFLFLLIKKVYKKAKLELKDVLIIYLCFITFMSLSFILSFKFLIVSWNLILVEKVSFNLSSWSQIWFILNGHESYQILPVQPGLWLVFKCWFCFIIVLGSILVFTLYLTEHDNESYSFPTLISITCVVIFQTTFTYYPLGFLYYFIFLNIFWWVFIYFKYNNNIKNFINKGFDFANSKNVIKFCQKTNISRHWFAWIDILFSWKIIFYFLIFCCIFYLERYISSNYKELTPTYIDHFYLLKEYFSVKHEIIICFILCFFTGILFGLWPFTTMWKGFIHYSTLRELSFIGTILMPINTYFLSTFISILLTTNYTYAFIIYISITFFLNIIRLQNSTDLKEIFFIATINEHICIFVLWLFLKTYCPKTIFGFMFINMLLNVLKTIILTNIHFNFNTYNLSFLKNQIKHNTLTFILLKILLFFTCGFPMTPKFMVKFWFYHLLISICPQYIGFFIFFIMCFFDYFFFKKISKLFYRPYYTFFIITIIKLRKKLSKKSFFNKILKKILILKKSTPIFNIIWRYDFLDFELWHVFLKIKKFPLFQVIESDSIMNDCKWVKIIMYFSYFVVAILILILLLIFFLFDNFMFYN